MSWINSIHLRKRHNINNISLVRNVFIIFIMFPPCSSKSLPQHLASVSLPVLFMVILHISDMYLPLNSFAGLGSRLCYVPYISCNFLGNTSLDEKWSFFTSPCSVTQSCPTLCDPMDHSTPVFLVFPEFAQIHVRHDGIQPSHPLSSPSSPTFNLSQHQGLFQ